MTNDLAPVEFLLGLGDNCLVLGQRLSEWCGHGPALEEDIALTNTALDLVGQARLWLTYAGSVEGLGRDEDELAFLRDAHQFRNVLLVEQPNGDYASTLARQFYFDAWHCLLLQGLTRSSDARTAAIAEKSLKEATYHAQRSSEWIVRLGDGTDESHARIQAALDALWPYTGELFEPTHAERTWALSGIATDVAALHDPWMAHVTRELTEATLRIPSSGWMHQGGKRGRHTEHLGHLLPEMQFLQRTYPGCSW
ncbi:phenylacetate-CoA oxygenase subunit PaaC [Pendulispora rubella]|uniref:Phenylacetate-CoA oxygenase subunit PaaC n=1 Tax=Pendulispora rubella TaxID=2741070 RepID=A0ABZ2LA21_9BACT